MLEIDIIYYGFPFSRHRAAFKLTLFASRFDFVNSYDTWKQVEIYLKLFTNQYLFNP